MSRPRLMTADRVQTILAHLAEGQTRAAAAVKAGLHDDTVRRWIARGLQERTRLRMLGLDVDAVDVADTCIIDTEREFFGFARAVEMAEKIGPAELHAVLYQAATEGLETVETRRSQIALEDGTMVDGPMTVTTKRIWDPKTAMWLLERMDPERYHLPARVELTGANGGTIQIAGMSDRQAEGFAIFVRVLLDEVLALTPVRSRAKLEKAIPTVLDVAMKAIEAPREEETNA